MVAVKKLALLLNNLWDKSWPLLFGVVAVATLLPLLTFAAGDRLWPGFFYAPFYTNNVLSDPTVPAAVAGLKPEDRVIGLNGVRIEFLREITRKQGQRGGAVSLVYELGRELAAINVVVEAQPFGRIVEKWVVFIVGGLGLAAWGWRKKDRLAQVGSMVLLASGDYWLNPGAERLSGFDPASFLASGEWGLATAKWSTYFYWPLWMAFAAVVGWQLIESLQARKRIKIYLRIVLAALTLAELAVYIYEAARTARFNNPDYITFHIRMVWWAGWALLLILALLVLWQQKWWEGWLGLAALTVLVVGFGACGFYAVEPPGIGPQWYALGLPVAVWAWDKSRNYAGKAARPRSKSAG